MVETRPPACFNIHMHIQRVSTYALMTPPSPPHMAHPTPGMDNSLSRGRLCVLLLGTAVAAEAAAAGGWPPADTATYRWLQCSPPVAPPAATDCCCWYCGCATDAWSLGPGSLRSPPRVTADPSAARLQRVWERERRAREFVREVRRPPMLPPPELPRLLWVRRRRRRRLCAYTHVCVCARARERGSRHKLRPQTYTVTHTCLCVSAYECTPHEPETRTA